jgi:hypothetical protein
MRVLRRHSDEDEAAVSGNEAREADRTAETPRTTDTQPVTKARERPAFADRFRRTTTVPVTVPRRALRHTVTVPGEPATTEVRWSPAAILATAAGAALAVVGVVALIRAEVNSTWFQPVVQVLDANHTPLLGAVEVGAGVLLILLGLTSSRYLVAAAGIAGALAATAVAVEPEELSRELAIESWWAWSLAAAGVVLALAALWQPRIRRRETVIDVR